MIGIGIGLNASRNAGGAIPFAPSDLSGLVGDFDPAGAGGIATDQSGTGNTLTLTGTAAGGGLNGHATRLFDGVDDEATRASFALAGGDGTTFVVVCKTITAPGFKGLVSYNGANNHSLYATWSTGPNYCNGVTTTEGPSIAAWSRVVATDTPGAMRLYVDGVATGAAAVPSNAFSTPGDFAIGSLSAGSFANVDIARVLVYSRALTAGELTQIDDYLTDTYGL